MLSKFELANLKRLEKCVTPIRTKIDRIKQNLTVYTRAKLEEIETLKEEIAGFETLIEDIKSRQTEETVETTTNQDLTGTTASAPNEGSDYDLDYNNDSINNAIEADDDFFSGNRA